MTVITDIPAQSDSGSEVSHQPTLSKRAYEVLSGTAELLEKFASLLGNQYSSENPNGIINFGVAENTLMQDELKTFLDKALNLKDLDFSYGDSIAGSTRLFKALSKLFDTYFNPVTKVLPDHFITGSGVSAVVDQTIQAVCDEGEAVLLATPYYSGFDIDVTIRARGMIVGVDTGDLDPASPETLKAFEEKLQELKGKGITTRAVILCNPHNPLGFNYPKETLLEYCRFCEKHNLHLLSDEIYALSQFKNDAIENPTPFISMLSIDVKKEVGCHPGRVHVLYGMSKDWGSNGFRIGTLVTQHNPQFRKALLGTALLMKVSSPADSLWSALLNDPQMVDTFIKTNQERLTDTFNHCFMYHYSEPGWFRFTFCIRRNILDTGLKRFESVLGKHKKAAS
ncbi:hypothetical protein FRC03_006275 [Tulasnella sp. 419]|nr:hypothetical protein FRC03_006275 [Tulasnella sp. 419]